MYFFTQARGQPRRRLPLHKTLVCLACVLLLVVNGFFLIRSLGDLRASNELQARTGQVNGELQELSLLLADAESNLRGYFLSGDEIYLGPLREAPQQIDNQLRALDVLLANSPMQATHLMQLRTLVMRKLASMHQALEVYRQGGLQEILAQATKEGQQGDMDEIRLQVVILSRLQNELLANRTEQYYREYRRAATLGVGINVAAIMVLLLFYHLIRRSFFLRLHAEDALKRNNDDLERLVAERTAQLSILSRHLIRVAEEEKARLARELHDEMGAHLTAIGIDLMTVSQSLESRQAELSATLDHARRTLAETVQLKRRITEDLRPSLLDNLGLSAALHSYCAEYARLTKVACDVLVGEEADQVAPMQAIALFRITQEALNNIAKYARAHSIVVRLDADAKGWELEITDDGVGISAEALAEGGSHGVLGMRERALLLEGEFSITRGVNGVGTCVRAWIPRAAPVAASGAATGALPDVGDVSPAPPAAPGAAPHLASINAPHP